MTNDKPARATTSESRVVRWGFVGTGSIAETMANVMQSAPSATLAAVSSRRMASAQAFADEHGASKAFDSWDEMASWDGVDAVYVATPTSTREEISVAVASRGKHVLAEKPFASLPSVRRIAAACRANGVAFMDGTHFVHHPRSISIRAALADQVGSRRIVDSAFQFNLTDRSNIRYDPALEPMGAIGDAGWYNMRAAVEYLSPDADLRKASAFLRRDEETGAATGGSGVLAFADGATSTWSCGFDSGAVLGQDPDNSAQYLYRKGGWGPDAIREPVRIESPLSGAALMFEDFATAVEHEWLRDQWIRAAERTQALLDAVWQSALMNEGT